MFCEKCGAENENTAKFCENCGNLIQEEVQAAPEKAPAPSYTYTAPSVVKEKKPMSKKNKIIMIAAIAVVAILGALYFVGKTACDPENIVKKYADGMASGNYAQVYECMDIEDGVFTSKEMFVKIIEKEDPEEIINYEVEESDESTNLTKRYIIKYTAKGFSGENEREVVLTKQKEKSWLIFDTYKVNVEDGIIKDVRFEVPKGVSITVGGVALGSEYLDNQAESSSTMDYYVIKTMLRGDYDVVATAPFIEEYKTSHNPGYGNAYISNLRLTNDAKNAITNEAKNLLSNLCNAAMQGKSYEEIKGYFSPNASDSTKSEYEDLCRMVKGYDGSALKSISFTEFAERNSGSYFDGDYRLYANFKYNYVYSYKEFASDTFTDYSPAMPNSGYMTADFVNENGAWTIKSFDVSIYF